ncbi:hypothetical protein BH11MYX1_BH11MYX1_25590 [soil metagenome]
MIQVGQVIDKYELLERVGQGGMAIVYRGLDRQLKRTVAIKVLHRHLSDYQEARDRFEREAQAVAKLRHENILEIFDYSAKEGFESYIVTEFIEGQTLKQFVTERPIAFPEIGAMLILQVCRALAHAHAGSILHRDVKPENIMIRSDGIVKLMDFGISHMVDLERLTVTGQLLGSPAYMAPEHVEGRPLDYRTDVFAAGIVLYQLSVGKLPFEGKNPHEVLKRIAECKFIDPRQANPRIGNRLGRIILKAMAAQPDDRYSAVGEMVLALEAYLEESGLPHDKVPAELARYFSAPASYEAALRTRLVDTLTRAGQAKLESEDRSGALDVFDRVLTIDPGNEKVLAILDRLNRRARLKTVVLLVTGVGALGVGGYAIHERAKVATTSAPNIIVPAGSDRSDGQIAHEVRPPDAAQVAVVVPDARAEAMVVAPRDAGRLAASPFDATPLVIAALDAGETIEPVKVAITGLFAGSQYRIGGQGPFSATGATLTLTVSDPIRLEIQNACCVSIDLQLDHNTKSFQAPMELRPASITPTCDVAEVSVTIDNESWSLGNTKTVTFATNAIETRHAFTVAFVGSKKIKEDPVQVTVRAGEAKEVKCALR